MFANLQALKIPEGDVTKIECNGSVLWELVETAKYTNQVPISIDTNGSIYDGDGWIGKKRLSSSGVLKDADYVSTTGYIPASSGAVVRIKGVEWDIQSYCYVCAYNDSFEFISAVNCNGDYGGGTVSRNGDLAVVTLKSNSNIAYVRVSAVHDSSDNGYSSVATPIDGPGSYLIVTVNEEIV